MVTKNLLFQKLPKKKSLLGNYTHEPKAKCFFLYFQQLLCFASSVSLSEGSCLACLAKGNWVFIHWSLISCIILNSNWSFFESYYLTLHTYLQQTSLFLSVELFRTMKELSSYILGLTTLPSSSPLAAFIGSLIEWLFLPITTCDSKCLKKC